MLPTDTVITKKKSIAFLSEDHWRSIPNHVQVTTRSDAWREIFCQQFATLSIMQKVRPFLSLPCNYSRDLRSRHYPPFLRVPSCLHLFFLLLPLSSADFFFFMSSSINLINAFRFWRLFEDRMDSQFINLFRIWNVRCRRCFYAARRPVRVHCSNNNGREIFFRNHVRAN